LTDATAIAAGGHHSLVGKLRRPDLLISKAAAGPYLGNGVYNTPGAERQTLTGPARRGQVRRFSVRVCNDGNTSGAVTVRGGASLPGSVVRYYSAGVEITKAMRSIGGWHPILASGARRQLGAQVKIGGRAAIESLKSATVTRHLARTRARRRQGGRPRHPIRGLLKGTGSAFTTHERRK
jgi:hypothetical protein